MLLATYNVNGIRARLSTLLAWLDKDQPDIVALQETKSLDESFPFDAFALAGYQVSCVGQKSFNGVAILSKVQPDETIFALKGQEHLGARFLAARFGHLWILNTYVPQGRAADNPMFQEKLAFLQAMGQYIKTAFKPLDHIIWLGDINVAPHEMDVYDPVKLNGQMGFHPQERALLLQVMQDCQLTDLFRHLNPDEKMYTFWDYRAPNGFKRDLGWRIDHMLVSAPLAAACHKCWVEKQMRGQEKPSDHAPLVALYAAP